MMRREVLENIITVGIIIAVITIASLIGSTKEVKVLQDKQEVETIYEEQKVQKEIPEVIKSMQSRQQLKNCMAGIHKIDSSIDIADDTLEYEYGITPDMYDTFYGIRSSIENSIDSVIVIKCKKAYKSEIENLLNDYIIRISDESSLRDMEKLKNYSVETYKDYAIISVLNKEDTDIIIDNIKNLPEI